MKKGNAIYYNFLVARKGANGETEVALCELDLIDRRPLCRECRQMILRFQRSGLQALLVQPLHRRCRCSGAESSLALSLCKDGWGCNSAIRRSSSSSLPIVLQNAMSSATLAALFLDIPGANRTVCTARHQDRAILTEIQRVNGSLVSCHFLHPLSWPQIPELNRTILARRGHHTAVWWHSDRVNGAYMSCKHADARASLHIPQSRSLVAWSGHHVLGIRVEFDNLEESTDKPKKNVLAVSIQIRQRKMDFSLSE